MTVSLSLLAGAGWQFFDDNGNPLSGGLLYTYLAGTTTPATTYTSSNGVTANSNPIVLDAAGRVSQEVWLTVGVNYKFILKTSADVTVWTKDNIPGGMSSDDVLFLQAGIGAVLRTAQSKMRDVVSVKDFGAVGNGSANDTAAIQAAFNSGAKQVVFPAGTYLCTTGLTVPNWLQVTGEGYAPTIATGTGAVVLRFTGTSGNFLTCGFNPVFENIVFWNSGGTYNDTTDTLSGTTAVGIKLTDNVTLNFCSFSTWFDCIRFGTSSYYVKTYGVEFNRCTNGYRVDGTAPYDVDIHSPISRKTTNFFVGEVSNPARNIKIFGGSIEGYLSIASNFLDLSSFGVYYETVATRAGAVAIDPGVNGASVTLSGNLIYLDYTARFVNLSGLTDCSLTSSGNQLEGVAPAAAIVYYLPSTGAVSLTGDKFGTGHPNNAVYVDSFSSAAKFNGIVFPKLPSGNTQFAYSGMTVVGPTGYIALGRTTAPSAPATGMTVLADGSSWDPLTRAYGRPYWVTWQGDRWRTPGGLT